MRRKEIKIQWTKSKYTYGFYSKSEIFNIIRPLRISLKKFWKNFRPITFMIARGTNNLLFNHTDVFIAIQKYFEKTDLKEIGNKS